MADEEFDDRTGVVIVALPAESDPITAASSEDIPHVTMVWLGDASDLQVSIEDIQAELASWAAKVEGPIKQDVSGSATLGAEEASVVLIDVPALAELRNGMIDMGDTPGPIAQAHDSVEQFPTWIPHVTLGYPETPATGEYAGDSVTFDRFALWVGNDRTEYPFGGGETAVTAAVETEEPDIEGEDLVDDIVEIPVHGVATIEGSPTGDGRMFAKGSLSNRPLPLPMRYEFVGTHGGDTSMAAPVGRIDELWLEGDEYRFRGTILTTKTYANEAIEGIMDGSLKGVSVEVDDVIMDVTEQREELRAMLEADVSNAGSSDSIVKSEMSVDEILDQMIGDGTQPVSVYSAARVCGFTIVPIPAYYQGYIALGEAFDDELTTEDQEALAACGCAGEAEFRDVPQEERDKLADEGNAMPDGSFPIANVDDLKNAIQSVGRATDIDAAKRHIIKRARELDAEDLIPEGWSAEALVAAAGTHDGPGWITNPRDTARIRRYWTHGKGAAKIRWGAPGDFNRCRKQLAKYVQNPEWLAGTCANMHKEAIGLWPGQEAGGKHSAVTASAGAPFTIVASAAPIDASYFTEQDNLEMQGVVVDGDRVYGYVATWGVCHIGIDKVCTTAPHSLADYGYFATGYVSTTAGDIRVGQITMDTGHADMRSSARVAASHYDNTGAAVADIAIGENAFGIWFAGKMRDSATAEQRHALKASGRLSGDWRDMGTGLELVAALAVNTPGFPTPVQSLAASAGRQTALIAAGIVDTKLSAVMASGVNRSEEMAAIARTAAREVLAEQKREQRLSALAPRRAELRTERLSRVRSRLTKEN